MTCKHRKDLRLAASVDLLLFVLASTTQLGCANLEIQAVSQPCIVYTLYLCSSGPACG